MSTWSMLVSSFSHASLPGSLSCEAMQPQARSGLFPVNSSLALLVTGVPVHIKRPGKPPGDKFH